MSLRILLSENLSLARFIDDFILENLVIGFVENHSFYRINLRFKGEILLRLV